MILQLRKRNLVFDFTEEEIDGYLFYAVIT